MHIIHMHIKRVDPNGRHFGLGIHIYLYFGCFYFRVAMQFVARLKKTKMPVCKFFLKFLKIPCNWREQMLIRAFFFIQFDNPIGKAIKYRNDALILGHIYTASETSRNIKFLFKKKMEKIWARVCQILFRYYNRMLFLSLSFLLFFFSFLFSPHFLDSRFFIREYPYTRMWPCNKFSSPSSIHVFCFSKKLWNKKPILRVLDFCLFLFHIHENFIKKDRKIKEVSHCAAIYRIQKYLSIHKQCYDCWRCRWSLFCYLFSTKVLLPYGFYNSPISTFWKIVFDVSSKWETLINELNELES